MGLFQKKRKSITFMAETHQRTLHKNLEFTATEQYKLLRTNLDFTLPDGIKCPVIGVTSSMRGEGKSTTALNLSYVIAEKGSKVLLIDGDLRIPSIAKKMQIPNSPGLTNELMEKNAPSIERFKSNVLDTWYIMPAGDIPPNPSELLGSKRMETVLNHLREYFDYIVIDLPPVGIVSDALSIANLISGLIMVIRQEYTERKEFEQSFQQLQLSNVKLLGCVMNATRTGSGSYRKYKNYKYYKKYKAYAEEDVK